MQVSRMMPIALDRTARLDAIRSELGNAIAFTARAHHGWGGPDPTPTPPPVPTVPPTTPVVPTLPNA